jgi:hypothetical protein
MGKLGHLLLLACFTILLVSCNGSTTSIQPDRLVVKRIDPLHQSNSEFEKTIDDQKQVLELYNKLKKLPSFPKGPISCPADNGVQYELTFIQGAKTVSNAMVSATGCQEVTVDKKVYKGYEFIAVLESVLGLSESEFRVGFASH